MSSTIHQRHGKLSANGAIQNGFYSDDAAAIGTPQKNESFSLPSSTAKAPSAFKGVAGWGKLSPPVRLRASSDDDVENEKSKSRRSFMTRKLQSCRRFTSRWRQLLFSDDVITTLSIPALHSAKPKRPHNIRHLARLNISFFGKFVSLLFGLFVVVPCIVGRYSKRSVKRRGLGRPMSLDASMQSPIEISNVILPGTDIHRPYGPIVPREATDEESGDTEGPAYANIHLSFLEQGGGARNIFRRLSDKDGHVYDKDDFEDDDALESYYAFDDDGMRRTIFTDRKENFCRRQAGHRLFFPTCNNMHELDLLEHESNEYLSHGYFRDVFKLKGTATEDAGGNIIYKIIRYSHNYDYETHEYTRMDALVGERLTASPRIVSFYGVCGVGLLSEFIDGMDMEQVAVPKDGYRKIGDLQDSTDVDPQNSLTPLEKLNYAISMAESIAILHGFKDGVIVHDDIQLPQFLLTKDGQMKLNDFNRAEFMLWDDTTQDYCRYRNGPAFGNYRSPEEYIDLPLNEKIDVWSMGNNIYALLTGLWPFYEIEDDVIFKDTLKSGELPFIDERYKTRSFIEGKLVDVLIRCWENDPDKRADIFEVVRSLREALAQYEQMEK